MKRRQQNRHGHTARQKSAAPSRHIVDEAMHFNMHRHDPLHEGAKGEHESRKESDQCNQIPPVRPFERARDIHFQKIRSRFEQARRQQAGNYHADERQSGSPRPLARHAPGNDGNDSQQNGVEDHFRYRED